jgi:TrmH family RNA methyltransferase
MNWMEAKSAVGAPDLLRDAKVFETLAEAVANCTLVLGTGSLDKRKPVQAVLSLPEAAAQIRHTVADPDSDRSRVALLFGSEKHGLTSDDLSWCHALIVIDTHEDQPSMNLGQSVAVSLYEISRNLETDRDNPSEATPKPILSADQPDSGQLDRLASLIEETMAAANYSTRGMRSANGEALRVLLRRLMPDEADLRRMMGLFRRILWKIRRFSEHP